MESITLSSVYKEVKRVQQDVKELRYLLLPVAKMTAAELREFNRIDREMQRGKKIPIENVLG